MSKSTITYRFDHKHTSGKQEPIREKGQIIPLHGADYKVVEESISDKKDDSSSPVDLMYDRQPLNQYTNDFGAWNSPFDLETEKLEEMIRESNRNQGRDQDRNQDRHDREDNFFAVEPIRENKQTYTFDSDTGYYGQMDPRQQGRESMASRYVRSTRTPWLKLFVSVSGAIVTGVLFGIFVLSLFMDDGSPDQTSPVGSSNNTAIVNEADPSNAASGSADTKDQAGSGVVSGEAVQVDLPAQSFFILQNGVFSGIEGADAAKQDLSSKGFAASSELNDSYFVFAGISTSRDDALIMSHQLQQQELETYIKTYSIPAVDRIHWQGEQVEAVQSYFIEGNQLTKMISNLTTVHLQQDSAQSISNESMETLRSAHQTWSSMASQVNGGISEGMKPTFLKMNNAMNTAVISLEAYKKNPSFSFLWQAQTALMEYTISQKALLTGIAAE
jgi:stage II sporulation protein B